METFQSWRVAASKAMLPLAERKTDGMSFDACIVHCQTLANATWNGYATEDGVSLRHAVEHFVLGAPIDIPLAPRNAAPGPSVHFDEMSWPQNPSCKQCHYVLPPYGQDGCVY